MIRDCKGTSREFAAALIASTVDQHFPILQISGLKIISERLRGAHREGFQRAMTSREARYAGRVMTSRAIHRDGSTLYVGLTFGLLKDSAGAVIGALAVGCDVTAREGHCAAKATRA
ncbi:MAG: hypothetical protein G3I10_00785 [Ferrovum sp.]|nr:hypothetical protein [Ferrovum sp.]